jgi:hypothetical protein
MECYDVREGSAGGSFDSFLEEGTRCSSNVTALDETGNFRDPV